MRTIAHISDSHFGTVDPRVRDALLADLHAAPPDLIALTGDLTQRARRRQYAEAARFLTALPAVPRLAVPGNHDLPLFDLFTRFRAPYGRFRRYVSDDLEPHYRDADVLVIGVDSTGVWRRKDGAISPAQRDRVGRMLEASDARCRIVMLHHPLAPVVSSDVRNVAHGARAALERWIGAGAALFLGGHIHLPYIVRVQDTAGRAAHVVQAGTGISRRVRDGIPNSYNRLIIDGATIRVERRDWHQGGFTATEQVTLPP